ncbi:MAG: hypothetical protein J6A09_00270 [Alphaproteobacteria bacterium]|nr:hypothetical protein [Alphaproteobacteria bacterium]
MGLKQSNQTGRSMIEMLGVLAIVGILSVGGISAYQKAMTKYKVNKWTEDVALMVQNFRFYSKDWIKIAKIAGTYTSVTKYFYDANLVPSNWFLGDNDKRLYNNFGSVISFSSYINVIYFSVRLKTGSLGVEEQCRNFFTQIILPQSEAIHWVHRYNSDAQASNRKNEEKYYGINYCTKTTKCLGDFGFEDIIDACKDAPDDGELLIMSVYLK